MWGEAVGGGTVGHARAGRMSRAGVGVGGQLRGVHRSGRECGRGDGGLGNVGGRSHCMGWRRGMRRGQKQEKGVRGECNIPPRIASLSMKISIKGKETYCSQPDCSKFLCLNLSQHWHR